jgi:hypothetical protein
VRKGPVSDTDIFMDNFIQVGQGGAKPMCALQNHLLVAVDNVLATPRAHEPHWNEAISIKKPLQEDGSWGTCKVVLGWLIDTVRQTIELPLHCKIVLVEIFQDLASTHRVTHKKYQSILRKLRFVSSAIPDLVGLFSALQLAHNHSTANRVRITALLHSHIATFASLAASLCCRPTHLAEIMPESPALAGTTDTTKAGMGRVYFDPVGQGRV